MSDFNYNEINKRQMAPNLLKSYGIDIEKAEGDKGGKIIGHTKSGKPIYAHNGFNVKHKDFTPSEHREAVTSNMKVAGDLRTKAKSGFNIATKRQMLDQADTHTKFAEEHIKEAHKKELKELDEDFDKEESKSKVEKGDVKLTLDNEKTLTKGGMGSGRHKEKIIAELNQHLEHRNKQDVGSEKYNEHSERITNLKNELTAASKIKEGEVEKGKTMTVDTQEMIDEHKKLTNVLDSPSHKDDKEESEEQKKELKEYKEKLKKSFEALGVDYIEKGGVGSGRKKYSTTTSGKDILLSPSKKSLEEDHNHFDSKDHHEASKKFDKQAEIAISAGNQDQATEYSDYSHWHYQIAKEKEKTEQTKDKINNPDLKTGLRK